MSYPNFDRPTTGKSPQVHGAAGAVYCTEMSTLDAPLATAQTLGYAAPADRHSQRLGAAAWLCVIGLGLIVLGGCFLIGVMFCVAGLPSAASSRLTALIGILSLCATACFSGAIFLLQAGVRTLLGMARWTRTSERVAPAVDLHQ